METVNKKILCFDIDGVICKTPGSKYNKSTPIKKNIKKINELYDKGYYIKLFTARFMGRSKENTSIASKKNLNFTVPQLKKWKIKYHKIIFGKPSYSLFIDDRNLFHRKDWAKLIDKEIKNK
jgi:histidinol phosphatase-like enzyme